MDLDLKGFLEHNKNDIVNFVEGNQRPIPIADNIFGKLLNKLMESIPIEKNGKVGLDKAHVELAIAVLESMWCGWLSQAKANRGVYTKEYVNTFRNAIQTAFEVGRNYSNQRS